MGNENGLVLDKNDFEKLLDLQIKSFRDFLGYFLE
jgi:hypothetical protein